MPTPLTMGVVIPAERICRMKFGPPGRYVQSPIMSGFAFAERRRVICEAIDGSLFVNVSLPTTLVPGRAFHACSKDVHSSFEYASDVSTRKYAFRAWRFL